MGCEYDEIADYLITAPLLTLAHDLALESRRKGVTGREYINDAVEPIQQSRTRILELLRCNRRQLRSVAGVMSEKAGRGGLPESQ